MKITKSQVQHWREHGYVVIENFLSPDELQRAQTEVLRYFPTSVELAASPARYRRPDPSNRHERAGILLNDFPFDGPTLCDISVHKDILDFIGEILGTSDVALGQTQLVAKYAGFADYEQQLHVDYGNNTPVAPSLDPSMMDVPAILYYSDVTMDLGPTYVVSRQHTQDVPLFPGTRPRSAENAALYEHEKPVLAKAGSLLLYSMHTFHRGSRMTATCGHRFTHHLGFHNGACRWQGTYSFHLHAEAPQYTRLIERSTPQQRWALGFPPPGHAYWDEQSLKLVGMRYPRIDMTPYVEAMSAIVRSH